MEGKFRLRNPLPTPESFKVNKLLFSSIKIAPGSAALAPGTPCRDEAIDRRVKRRRLARQRRTLLFGHSFKLPFTFLFHHSIQTKSFL
jgi:hypothetical protein